MKRRDYITALALYITYFVHGIGVSILSQYKESLAGAWQAPGISTVLQVIAALGLGRLVALPISGYVSDRFGRKVSGLIGILFYTLFFSASPPHRRLKWPTVSPSSAVSPTPF